MGFSREAAKYLVINTVVWLVVSWADITRFTRGSTPELLLALTLWIGGPSLLALAWVHHAAASSARVPFRPLLAVGLTLTAMPFLLAVSPTMLYVQLGVQGCYVLAARRAWG